MEESEKQLEDKRKLELARDEAERLKFKAEERRKPQKAKGEAARLVAEAAIFEKAQNEDHDPVALPNRLLDFAGESLEFEHSNAVQGRIPIIPKPLLSLNSHEAEANLETLLSTNERHCISSQILNIIATAKISCLTQSPSEFKV